MLKRSPVILVLLAVIGLALVSGVRRPSAFAQQPLVGQLSAEQRRAIQLVISGHATPGGFFTRGRVIDQSIFKLGEPVHIGIAMTNTARASIWVCAFSNNYYQNRPQLTRDGELVAYSEKLIEGIRRSDAGECVLTRTPDFINLKPNVPLRVPTIELQDWYGPLVPGHYKLFMKRTFACCADGQWNPTNTISFDVTR